MTSGEILVDGTNVTEVNDYFNVNVSVHLSINKDFHKAIIAAYEQGRCEDALKLIVDLYIALAKIGFTLPGCITLNSIFYIDKQGLFRPFENCSVLLKEKDSTILSKFYNKLYRYKGYTCRYINYNNTVPCLEILGHELDITELRTDTNE